MSMGHPLSAGFTKKYFFEKKKMHDGPFTTIFAKLRQILDRQIIAIASVMKKM